MLKILLKRIEKSREICYINCIWELAVSRKIKRTEKIMSIVFDENKRVFKLDTEKSSYAFHITDSRNLLHLYYGGYIPETDITHMLRIPNDEPFVPAVHDAMGPHSFDCAPIEFPTSGVADFREPAMQVMDINGMSACECYYKDYRISNGKPKLKGLPATYAADDEAQTLEVFC